MKKCLLVGIVMTTFGASACALEDQAGEEATADDQAALRGVDPDDPSRGAELDDSLAPSACHWVGTNFSDWSYQPNGVPRYANASGNNGTIKMGIQAAYGVTHVSVWVVTHGGVAQYRTETVCNGGNVHFSAWTSQTGGNLDYHACGGNGNINRARVWVTAQSC